MGLSNLFNTGNDVEETLGLIESLVAELKDPDLWIGIGTDVLFAVALIIVAGIIVKVLNRIIENYFTFKSKAELKGKNPKPGNAKRNKTLINVLQNAVSIFIWFVVFVMVLETFGVPVATLLAGAGVVGLAIGFGAQSIVKDMLTGFFILLENQFDTGDFVRINTSGTTVAEGEVLSMGLRISKIQGYEGELFIIPNGTINEVINFSKYNSISFLDINLSLTEDLDHVEDLLNSYAETAMDADDSLVEKPQVLGLNDIVNGEAIMRVMLITQPMEHFGATRRNRKAIKNHLAENGVYISVPSMDIQDFDESVRKGEE
ncbi:MULTISPECIES: mechanosensitive ion channel family protein [Bacillales]|uniref:Small conductance mechanosensitive channel n=1 Tax=Lacicoccus qingdaonensis TaxID=576118 RepID=A0A1G9ELL6_9BACL|nr:MULTISPECIES: mechanosensitive ion channel family protein [Salinicoccus]SDK76915.1 small conductance mechanosensitive channel [Salinicoccus qingdaonensis]